MATLATRPFWLDGGYDRDCVDACQYAPLHNWWVFRLGDVLDCERAGKNPDEQMVICRCCYVPRCGPSVEPNPCVLPRHHDGNCVFAQGAAT